MAVDIHKNYPYGCLEDSYEPKDSSGIVEGHMVFQHATTGKIELAVGAVDEYAMLAMNSAPLGFMDQSEKIQCIKEGGTFWTDKFKAGVSYTYGGQLQVSVAGGEEGILTIHAGGTAPVIGRYRGTEVINNVQMILFDLVRS